MFVGPAKAAILWVLFGLDAEVKLHLHDKNMQQSLAEQIPGTPS